MKKKSKKEDLDRKAHLAAKLVNVLIEKCEGELSETNKGGYMIIDSVRGGTIKGEDFDLSAEAVIEVCHRFWDNDLSGCRSDSEPGGERQKAALSLGWGISRDK
jgi:hypothetical protein